MNAESDNFTTPKQTKRLGLRRSSSIIKNNSAKKATGSGAKSKTREVQSPTITPRKRVAQSDVKVNYKHLEQSDHNKSSANLVSTPDTPKNASSIDLQRVAVSTNCRPYRLALSKKVRERMTKKRLEFYVANEMEKETSEAQETNQDKHEKYDTASKTFNSREELLEQIEIVRRELAMRQEHFKKVEELKQLIDIWKVGFSSALHDLQQKVEPRLETAELLQRLHIPQEMIKYIND